MRSQGPGGKPLGLKVDGERPQRQPGRVRFLAGNRKRHGGDVGEGRIEPALRQPECAGPRATGHVQRPAPARQSAPLNEQRKEHGVADPRPSFLVACIPFAAIGLGHPLLHDHRRSRRDVSGLSDDLFQACTESSEAGHHDPREVDRSSLDHRAESFTRRDFIRELLRVLVSASVATDRSQNASREPRSPGKDSASGRRSTTLRTSVSGSWARLWRIPLLLKPSSIDWRLSLHKPRPADAVPSESRNRTATTCSFLWACFSFGEPRKYPCVDEEVPGLLRLPLSR